MLDNCEWSKHTHKPSSVAQYPIHPSFSRWVKFDKKKKIKKTLRLKKSFIFFPNYMFTLFTNFKQMSRNRISRLIFWNQVLISHTQLKTLYLSPKVTTKITNCRVQFMYKTQLFKLCQIVTFLLRPLDLVFCYAIVSLGNSSSWTCVEKQISVWIGLFFTVTGDRNPFLATREPKSHLPTPTQPAVFVFVPIITVWFRGDSVTLFLMF